MQRARSHSFSNSWRSLAVIVAALVVAPSILRTQQVSGALGVTLTVLPPVGTRTVELLAFDVERDGVARLETTAPAAGAVSLIVMATVASSADGFVPVAQAPVLVEASHRRPSPGPAPASRRSRAPRMTYRVNLGPRPAGSDTRDASVRISYLVVPGT
jgi:hypothetical protein